MHWELRISPSVRRSEIFPIEKHPRWQGFEATAFGQAVLLVGEKVSLKRFR